MEERSYAIAIAVILAICCLGMYVAVTGYLNTQSPASSEVQSQVAFTPVVIAIPTVTIEPAKAGTAPPPAPTSGPAPTPLGAFQTIVAATTVPTVRSNPTAAAKASPLSPTAAPPPAIGEQSCSGYAFCASGGPPDAELAPTGVNCPRNYVWGRVTDASGKGLAGFRIRFKGPLGDLDTVESKGPPDPPGIYNIAASPPGGKWTVWILDPGGGQASPQFTVTAPQAYTGSGNCPTRIDFKGQK